METATAPPPQSSDERSLEVHLDDLRRAVRSGDLEIVRVILSVDPQLARAASRHGGSLLLEAHEREHAAVTDAFVLIREQSGGLDLDLHEAAALARPADLRLALTRDTGAVMQPGPAGFHALHRAAFAGDEECVSLLLEAGADPAARSENGGRLGALHSAVAGAARTGDSDGHRAVIQALIAAGADPEFEMEGGWTARSAAARDGLSACFLFDGRDPANASDGPA